MSRETDLLRAQLLIEAADLLEDAEVLDEGFSTNYRKHADAAWERLQDSFDERNEQMNRYGAITKKLANKHENAKKATKQYEKWAGERKRIDYARPEEVENNLDLKNRKWGSDPKNVDMHNRINYRTANPKTVTH